MVVAIIPIYNPADIDTFYSFVKKVQKKIQHIIVVDDGSLIPVTIKMDNIFVLRNKVNRGKGYSLNKGFEFAVKKNFESAITIDGDGQHDPESIIDFLNYKENVDIVIGKRNFYYPMPIHRRLSNFITSLLLSIRIGIPIFDSQSGFRKYSLNTLCKYEFFENGFNFESEILIKILLNGGRVAHVNIPTIYNDSNSHINKFDDTVKFISLFFRSLFW